LSVPPVGCGICAAVCLRGVLKLENDTPAGRINANEILLGNDVNLMDLLNNNMKKQFISCFICLYSGLSSQKVYHKTYLKMARWNRLVEPKSKK
jgi:ferredoxin